MLKQSPDTVRRTTAPTVAIDGEGDAFEIIEGDLSKGILLVCDHATNALPEEYGTLGLPEDQLNRHIAHDIGVADVTRGLASAVGIPAVLSTYSRLLIDPNRGADDPTLVMQISDGSVIPGNVGIGPDEIARRLQRFHEPYHRAIDGMIDAALALGVVPALLSIHSFTPHWKGMPRIWHAGILWDRDDRLARYLIDALRAEGDLVVGDNEPYSGELEGDCMNRHGTGRSLAHALIEIRQDLIGHPEGVSEWIDRLARLVAPISAMADLHVAAL